MADDHEFASGIEELGVAGRRLEDRPAQAPHRPAGFRRQGGSVGDDLIELWQRVAFTVLVSNTDDHWRNHGFIYAGGDRWRRSPAFDINPSPQRQRVLQTGILDGEPFDASLELAMTAAVFSGLDAPDAERLTGRMAREVKRHWKAAMRAEGASTEELREYAPAFEHEDMERARRLDS